MTSEKHLVLYNDNEHTYNYVTASLIRFCRHDFLQAEQCAVITNNVGKCVIKQGDIMELLQIQENLDRLNLKTEIA
jgi:ATP-dependent Clp protease adaptor protein ClpS